MCYFMGIKFLNIGIKNQKMGTAEIRWLRSYGAVKFQINFVVGFNRRNDTKCRKIARRFYPKGIKVYDHHWKT
jgi:hypothetical protein